MKLLVFSLLCIVSCARESASGLSGANGLPGQVGAIGTPGVDAAPVTVVKLCPDTTVYPGIFVEVALCISNRLYGVYSANNGFLVELVPGTYHSNALNSSCNLEILNNCVVNFL